MCDWPSTRNIETYPRSNVRSFDDVEVVFSGPLGLTGKDKKLRRMRFIDAMNACAKFPLEYSWQPDTGCSLAASGTGRHLLKVKRQTAGHALNLRAGEALASEVALVHNHSVSYGTEVIMGVGVIGLPRGDEVR